VIWGESGTGKELVARAVHLHSPRANGPFEAVNCAALPASLIQSELFGHEKGSFTGADRCKIGRFEAASGGTIFLDEIGDLSPELQVILLRVLEQKVMRRVGGTRDIPIDVRVVAATHVDLQKAVANNVFREDLYYRLNVLHLDIPPLRDRAEDIELIAKHYLEQFSSKNNPRVRGFSEGALEVMNYHPWPGNVRELINRVHQATILAEGRMIGASDLGLERRGADRDKMTLDEIRDSAEKTAIAAALARARNNVSRAARDLGISRTTMYRFMEKHSIRT
jgi:DNA-binding NtrC family response regulator